ncbi:MAG: hypothetical protein IPO25_14940 [Saprospiraceae bacterium]|nr:hypothetical protein [Saprospiraceae bacterium]
MLTAKLATKITGTSEAVMNEYGYDRKPYKEKECQQHIVGFKVEKFSYNELAKKLLAKSLIGIMG